MTPFGDLGATPWGSGPTPSGHAPLRRGTSAVCSAPFALVGARAVLGRPPWRGVGLRLRVALAPSRLRLAAWRRPPGPCRPLARPVGAGLARRGGRSSPPCGPPAGGSLRVPGRRCARLPRLAWGRGRLCAAPPCSPPPWAPPSRPFGRLRRRRSSRRGARGGLRPPFPPPPPGVGLDRAEHPCYYDAARATRSLPPAFRLAARPR